MMSCFWKLSLFGMIMTYSPGPNNIMLASSGANFGFRKSLPHMLGIVLGFEILVIGSSLGIGALLEASPNLSLGLKCIGAAYLLYLAFKIATNKSKLVSNDHSVSQSKQNNIVNNTKPLTVMQAALFQPLNPKAWFIAVSGLALYIPHAMPMTQRTILAVVAFLLPTTSSTITWVAFGRSVRRFFADPVKLKRFNQATAAILVAMIALLFI